MTGALSLKLLAVIVFFNYLDYKISFLPFKRGIIPQRKIIQTK